MEKGLKDNIVKGVKWTSLNTIFNAFSAPFYQVALALLLIPQEFAYIAVISLVIGLSELMSNMGIGEAVIQKKEVNSKQISTLFYFNGLISLIIASLFYIAAPFIQNFYELPNMENIIRLLVITILINGISSIFRVYLQRNLLFKEFSLIQIVRTLTDIIITIIFILFGFGIMGYVYGTIASTLLGAILLMKFALKKTDLKILIHFNIKDAFPFLNFGLSISFKKILTFVSQRVDEIIIGGILSSEILGVYYFGKRLILQLQSIITNSFSQVLLPVFSKIKNNLSGFKNAYMKVTYVAAMVAFPIFVGITITAHLTIPIIFGEQWSESIIVVQVLSLVMVFQVLTANIATSALYSINKPNLVLFIDFFTISLYFISLFIFSNEGILMILSLFSMYTISKTIILQYFVSKIFKYRLIDYIYQLKAIILSTVIMAFLVLLVQYVFGDSSELIQLIISIVVGVFVYIALQWLIDRENVKMFITTFLQKGSSK